MAFRSSLSHMPHTRLIHSRTPRNIMSSGPVNVWQCVQKGMCNWTCAQHSDNSCPACESRVKYNSAASKGFLRCKCLNSTAKQLECSMRERQRRRGGAHTSCQIVDSTAQDVLYCRVSARVVCQNRASRGPENNIRNTASAHVFRTPPVDVCLVFGRCGRV